MNFDTPEGEDLYNLQVAKGRLALTTVLPSMVLQCYCLHCYSIDFKSSRIINGVLIVVVVGGGAGVSEGLGFGTATAKGEEEENNKEEMKDILHQYTKF